MRTAPRAPGLASAALAATLTSLIALLPMSCNGATQVRVTVTTDVPCDRMRSLTITTGAPEELDSLPFSLHFPNSKDRCTPFKEGDEDRYTIGDIYVTPSAGRGDKFGIRVVLGVDSDANQCDKGVYNGCVVARRSLSFISHATLDLPIHMSSSCEDVPCPGKDPLRTCVLGQCATAEVACAEGEECSDDVLTGPGKNVAGQAACGLATTIADTFDDAAASSIWLLPDPLPMQGGVLTLAPADEAKPIEYRSKSAVKLLDDAIRVEVPAMVSAGTQARAYLAAEYDGTRRIAIEQKGGKLSFQRPAELADHPVREVAYDPVKHKVWEIRSTPTKITMLTSPDGYDWTIGDTFTRPDFADFVNLVLGVDVDEPGEDPGVVQFDNLNLWRESPAVWCPAAPTTGEAPFSDDLEDDVVKLDWSVIVPEDEACTLKREGGGVVFASKAFSPGICEYRSRTAFDLTNSTIVVNVSGASGFDFYSGVYLALEDDNNTRVEIGINEKQFEDGVNEVYFLNSYLGSSNDADFLELFPPEKTQIYLHLGMRDGVLVWGTSTDGNATLKTVDGGFFTKSIVPNAVRVAFGVTTQSNMVENPIRATINDLTSVPTPKE